MSAPDRFLQVEKGFWKRSAIKVSSAMTTIAPRSSGSFRRQSFGNLGQKSKTHFLFGPPPADEVDTSPVHEETVTLDPSDDKQESKEVSRLESNNDDDIKKSLSAM